MMGGLVRVAASERTIVETAGMTVPAFGVMVGAAQRFARRFGSGGLVADAAAVVDELRVLRDPFDTVVALATDYDAHPSGAHWAMGR
jgi:hypothetical protein